jgi:ribose transport system permease protein
MQSKVGGMSGGLLTAGNLSQKKIVAGIAVLLFVGFALIGRGFFSYGNMLSLLLNVSILGILSVAMAIVVISRGIDLALVATMAVSLGWVLSEFRLGIA